MNQKGKCLLKHFFTCHKVNLTSKKSYCSSVLKLREIFQIYFSARTKNFFKVFGPCGELRLYLKSHFVWKLTCYSPLNSPQIPALRVKVVLMVFLENTEKGSSFDSTFRQHSWHPGTQEYFYPQGSNSVSPSCCGGWQWLSGSLQHQHFDHQCVQLPAWRPLSYWGG